MLVRTCPAVGWEHGNAQTAQVTNPHLCIQQDSDAASVQVVVVADFLDHLAVGIVITVRHVQSAQ